MANHHHNNNIPTANTSILFLLNNSIIQIHFIYYSPNADWEIKYEINKLERTSFKQIKNKIYDLKTKWKVKISIHSYNNQIEWVDIQIIFQHESNYLCWKFEYKNERIKSKTSNLQQLKWIYWNEQIWRIRNSRKNLHQRKCLVQKHFKMFPFSPTQFQPRFSLSFCTFSSMNSLCLFCAFILLFSIILHRRPTVDGYTRETTIYMQLQLSHQLIIIY